MAGREEQVRRNRLAAEHDRVCNALRETIARLERERDEARRDLRVLATGVFSEVEAERDAARQDAARMRLKLEAIRRAAEQQMDDDRLARRLGTAPAYEGISITNPAAAITKLVEQALTPDDGWLARKLAEAVEPYRKALTEMVKQGPGVGTVPALIQKTITHEAMAAFDKARALLGGTPTKEGE